MGSSFDPATGIPVVNGTPAPAPAKGVLGHLQEMGALPAAVPAVAPAQPAPAAGPAVPPVAPSIPAEGAPPSVQGQPQPEPEPRPGTVKPTADGRAVMFVVSDGKKEWLDSELVAADHSYKAHNTRIAQANRELEAQLRLKETELLAKENSLVNQGGQFFSKMTGAVEPAPTVPGQPVVPAEIPPMPQIELAVDNPEEYARQLQAHTAADTAQQVSLAIAPLAQKLTERENKDQEAAQRNEKTARANEQIRDLHTRIPDLNMDAVNAFVQRLPEDQARVLRNPLGAELVWGRIIRGETPDGTPFMVPAPIAPGPAPAGYPPAAPPAAYRPPVAPPPVMQPVPYMESAAPAGYVGAGAVPQTVPANLGTDATSIAAALKANRAARGATPPPGYYGG